MRSVSYAITANGAVAGTFPALPLGELSPEVTERALPPVLNGNISLFAHATKISVNIPIGKSQNIQAQSGQKCGAFHIIRHPLRLIMLGAIYFDNQLCRGAVKVHNEFADDSLFVNFYRIFAEKKIPELTFVGCHFPAKPSGIF